MQLGMQKISFCICKAANNADDILKTIKSSESKDKK
jgi:hypothetical protein